MNFFEHQQLARRNSRVMVLLFALSVIAIVLAVNVVVAVVYAVADAPESAAPTLASVPRSVWAISTVVTLGIIFVVSLVNIVGLAGGGAKVAKMMGARAVASNSQDRLERRLLNIVEEMSLASGVRLPQVYIMDGEKAINAFAAGWSVSGAVVCVTRGTLERLTRDELQGVIGHEFSHILNGDMGLNIRMIGVLAGIVAIGSVGGFVMRGAFEADDLRAAIPLFLVGLAIFTVGYTGLFFARLIKAAVSRQREFLADASSVQFTRNPDGIAGALDQIRASGAGTLIQGRYAEEMSHMFFGQSVKMKLAGLFQTHPPLEERIRRVHPGFQLSAYRGRRASEPATGAPASAGFAGEEATAVPPSGRRRVDNGTAWGRSAGESAQLFGALQPGKIDTAARLLAALPAGLRECLRETDGARAAIISLLFAPQEEVRREQLAAMKAAGLDSLAAGAAAAAPLTRGLGVGFHLPVIDLALPAVKAAPEMAKKELLAGIEAVINADRRFAARVRRPLAGAPSDRRAGEAARGARQARGAGGRGRGDPVHRRARRHARGRQRSAQRGAAPRDDRRLGDDGHPRAAGGRTALAQRRRGGARGAAAPGAAGEGAAGEGTFRRGDRGRHDPRRRGRADATGRRGARLPAAADARRNRPGRAGRLAIFGRVSQE